jgi:hydroxymethylbilane synthase
MSASKSPLRLGTRASPLARWQAGWVADQLAAQGVAVELVPITTQGDVHTGPLGQIGGQGLFTKELQRALLEGQIDLAVHSLKDLPTAAVPGLVLAAVPARESTADCLLCRQAESLDALPQGARVGTGSLRRKAQLLHHRPDLVIEEIRGNVDTRLRKLEQGQYDAIVLAEAGLRRLGLAERITQILPRAIMLPAVGQGALGLETRADDAATQQAVKPLDDRATRAAVLAERALLAALRAGCLAPVAALAELQQDQLVLTAAVLSPDGRQKLSAEAHVTCSDPLPQAALDSLACRLGEEVAQRLLSQGAQQLIELAHRPASG